MARVSAQARAAAREHLTALLTANAQDPADFDVDGIVDYLEHVAVGPNLVRNVNPAVLRAAIIARRHLGRFNADTITRELTATTADPTFVHELLMHRCMDEPEHMVDALAELVARSTGHKAAQKSADAIVEKLNAYEGNEGRDVWQDVIVRLDEYDPDATESADPNYASDVVVLTDGSVIRWDAQRDEWYVA